MAGRRRRLLAFLPLVVALASQAGEGGAQATAPAHGLAYAVKILLPNQQPIVEALTEGPPTSHTTPRPFTYPQDGSVVRVDSVATRVRVVGSAALAGADLKNVSLFGGEITAAAAVARSVASAGQARPSGGFGATSLTNLVVLGQSVAPVPHLRVQLGDWGHAFLLNEEVPPSLARGPRYRGWVTTLDVWLDADHAGLPVGTRILIGYADAAATAPSTHPKSAPRPSIPKAPRSSAKSGTRASGAGRASRRKRPVFPLVLPPSVTPPLTAGAYVFPVYGPAGFGDTFGAPRPDVDWHHGTDIVAPLGAPVLAVADGTLFSVGRNKLGGNRLWLRDRKGNEFYYAHLSAFAPLAVNGARVRAGAIIGFVGNTGDAEGGPYHLHFEIHPASLLFLGQDGVADPVTYLRSWKHATELRFPAAAVWAPAIVATSRAAKPGAILLQASDISSASGLDPGSLEAALRSSTP